MCEPSAPRSRHGSRKYDARIQPQRRECPQDTLPTGPSIRLTEYLICSGAGQCAWSRMPHMLANPRAPTKAFEGPRRGSKGSRGGRGVKEQSSVDAAVLVLADAKGDRFRLTCSCGWQTHENRDWVKHRIERHFAW